MLWLIPQLQEIQLPKVVSDLAADLVKHKEGIGFVSFGVGMLMKMANFNAQLDLFTGKIVWPDIELQKASIAAQEQINSIPKKPSPGFVGPGYPAVPYASWIEIEIGGPGAGFPIPIGKTPEEQAQIDQAIDDLKKKEKAIFDNFGKVAIADIFILIGFGLMFGDAFVKGLSDVINFLMPKIALIATP